MQKTKRTLVNIFWGFMNRFVHIIFPFIIRTIIIKTLGNLYTGLDGLFSSLLNMLSLAELGFGTAITYAMYKPLAENDTDKVCALLSVFRKYYRYIGLVIMILGIALLPFLKFFINGDCPENVNIYILYSVYLLNTVISYFMYAYKSSLLTATQRNDVVSNVNTLFYIIQSVLQMIVLLVWHDYYLFAIILPISSVFTNLSTAFCSKKLFPQYECRGNIGKEETKNLLKNIKGIFYQKIGTVILCNVDNIVISAFLGLNILTLYNNYYYIISALFSFMTIIGTVLIPSVGNSIVIKTVEENYSEYKIINFIYNWISAWMACCLLSLFQPFILLWLGEEYLLPIQLVILLAVYFFINKWMDILNVYLQAAGIWWETRFVPLIAAVLNLITNIILVNFIGLYGIVISTIVSLILVYDIMYLIYVMRLYFNKTKDIKKIIARQVYYLFVTLITMTFCYVISTLVKFDGVLRVVIISLNCAIVPNVMMMLFYKKVKEYEEAKVLVKKLLTRG